ncbi:MAG: Hsp20/alpha crystallin family protein [Elusimicrobiota bacterium]|nr:Hsp20/alpha crystallin family protein [Elusimicrobiota bacterium]
MMSIVSRFAAAMIATVVVVEGYYVYLQKALTPPAAAAAFQAVHDQWVSDVESMRRDGGAAARGKRPAIGGQAPGSLEDWFNARADAAGIRSEIFTTDSEVIVTFNIPGLQSDSVKVAVDNVRVLITCVADIVEEGGAPGTALRREGLRQYELIMPLPSHADSARHRVVRDKDKGAFRIIFTKLDDPSLKS